MSRLNSYKAIDTNAKSETVYSSGRYVTRRKKKMPEPRGVNGWCKKIGCIGEVNVDTGVCPVCGRVAPVIVPMKIESQAWNVRATAEMPDA